MLMLHAPYRNDSARIAARVEPGPEPVNESN